MLLQSELQSNPGLDPRVTGEPHMSKRDICRSGLLLQKTRLSGLIERGRRDAGVRSITETSAHTTRSHEQGQNCDVPLRRELARRSVKNHIFACMDNGDKKAEIESTTGLSHRCIKWHRRLWRNECSHPRPRSKKPSKNSARGPRSPGTRSERQLRNRPACTENGDALAAGESSSDRRRRKHRAVKQSKERSMRTGMKMPGPGEGACAEMETRASGCFAGNEDVPERAETMAISGEFKVLPFRDLAS